jgi:hypothetical protein
MQVYVAISYSNHKMPNVCAILVNSCNLLYPYLHLVFSHLFRFIGISCDRGWGWAPTYLPTQGDSRRAIFLMRSLA